MNEKTTIEPDRSVLPIQAPANPPCEAVNAAASTPPPRFAVKAPAGAPNVVLVLLDDMGFGACDTFGGPIPMRAANRLAENGLRYTRFHTTALCAPTRAAILTGYNHHTNNMGSIPELGTAFPGNTSVRPATVTPLARILRDNGYATAQFGKCHEVPTWEITPFGPFDHWPTSTGFDKFYGFVGCQTNQYSPQLYDGTRRLPVPNRAGYHLTEDLADKAIDWMRFQKALFADKPFFLYFAPGATHTPHQVPREYVDRFKGCFDEGWDALRIKTLARMKDMGIVPQDTKLAEKPADIADWDSHTPREKELLAREMEVYAAFAAHTDDQINRLIDCLEDMDILDNTLFLYVLGDNGASAEGQARGLYNEQTQLNGIPEDFAFFYNNMDKLGSDEAYNQYAMGWAIAADAPFTWAKQVASDFGGTRNGLVVHYPKEIQNGGGLRTQFHHCVDLAPTILEAAGIDHPHTVDGVPQRPLEGKSMAYSFREEKAPSVRNTQYFCNMSNYGIYHEGWFAGVVGKYPWSGAPRYKSYEEGVWELYDIEKDFSLSTNLAGRFPDKVTAMKAVFEDEARKYNVFPIDNRGNPLFTAKVAGRPDLSASLKSLSLRAGMESMQETCFPNLKNTSYRITADIDVQDGCMDGVILCQGGKFGGWSLYVHQGVPTFCYNFLAQKRYYVRAQNALVAGKNQIEIDFRYDGGGQGAGGLFRLSVNGIPHAEQRAEQTFSCNTSFDETANAGVDIGTPVSEEYTCANSRFQGDIYRVHVQIEP
ncbi:MAG: arylsulfatase [Clostridiales bacterium]|nr:arylsulfatase [Clostridiales bacterium]